MPLIVQNTEPNVTVFAKGGISLIWKPAGDPMGDDTLRVPDSLADDVDFLATLDKGILVVTGGTDPEVMKKIEASSEFGRRTADYQARQQAAAAGVESTIDRRQDRDIMQMTCIAPANRGQGECGNPVLVAAAKRGDEPPLCGQHKSLASQFYLVQGGSAGEGATENKPGAVSRVWKRVEMTAPVRG